MANRRLSMRKVREVLRLYHGAGLSIRAIARSLGVSPTTVGDYRRAERQGLTWPLPGALDDAALQRRMLMSPTPPSGAPRPLPEWSEVHRELRRKGVTLTLRRVQGGPPRGVAVQPVLRAYRAFASTRDVVMRQEHRAGEKMFVDYAQTVPVVSARRRSSRCSGRRATPSPRRPGRRPSRTGRPRTFARSSSSAAVRSW